ncbi:YjbQ family protein [Candidatus Micrarchaeota archaeon]|nr:YjbQ family protein [Candidatus Micrarchaeota archaeon]
MKTISIKTSKKIEVLDITEKIADNAGECRAVLVFAPHATAALAINEYEPNIKSDYELAYQGIVPKEDYAHNKIDDNAEAHILSSILSPSLIIPVENKKLVLGTWQSILFVELDGPRTRRIHIQTL